MCKSFSRGLSGDIWVTLGSRWLSSGLIVMGGLSLAACHRDVAAPHSAPKLAGQSQPALTPKADIKGQWHITQVTGGPVKVYPGGHGMPGITLDLNQVWSGGLFEFQQGLGALTIPAVGRQPIGAYELQGDSIVFTGVGGAVQRMGATLKGGDMALSLTPDEYQKTFAKVAAGGEAKLDVASTVVFHLRRR